jgi:hypothetical protein
MRAPTVLPWRIEALLVLCNFSLTRPFIPIDHHCQPAAWSILVLYDTHNQAGLCQRQALTLPPLHSPQLIPSQTTNPTFSINQSIPPPILAVPPHTAPFLPLSRFSKSVQAAVKSVPAVTRRFVCYRKNHMAPLSVAAVMFLLRCFAAASGPLSSSKAPSAPLSLPPPRPARTRHASVLDPRSCARRPCLLSSPFKQLASGLPPPVGLRRGWWSICSSSQLGLADCLLALRTHPPALQYSIPQVILQARYSPRHRCQLKAAGAAAQQCKSSGSSSAKAAAEQKQRQQRHTGRQQFPSAGRRLRSFGLLPGDKGRA